jgi:hypothetical protein
VAGTVLDGVRWNRIKNIGNNSSGAIIHWNFQFLLCQENSPFLLTNVPESFNSVELRLIRWILDAFKPGLCLNKSFSLFANVNRGIVKEDTDFLLLMVVKKLL